MGHIRSTFSSGYRRYSRTLTAGQKRDMMGRGIVPESAGLPGLGIGVIMACFEMVGML